MNYKSTPEFAKEFKKLSKKYRSLGEDIGEFKKIIENFPLGTGRHFNILTNQPKITVVKARLFCKYLKGSSLRIIYSYSKEEKYAEFIEIYPKNKKSNEDRGRIRKYLSKF